MTVNLTTANEFIARHIGPRQADEQHMLASLGFDSLEALSASVIPESIKGTSVLGLEDGLSEAEAFGRFAQDIAQGLGLEGMVPPAFMEAYKQAEGMSTTERPLPQSEPHMQAMIDAGILNPRPQEGGRPK